MFSRRIVAIPGVGTKPPEKWDSNTGALWERLGESGRRPIAVYTFHHDIDLVEDFSWQAILDGGPALLHSLLELRKNVQVHPFFAQ